MTGRARAVGIDLVAIPAGELAMGSTLAAVESAVRRWAPHLLDPSFSAGDLRCWLMKEFPRHPVAVGAYAISRHPVTNGQYRAFVDDTAGEPAPSLVVGEPEDHPVWGVTPDGASGFCDWLSAGATRRFRLPTEAEWEYAARGPTTVEYPFGDRFDPARCNTAEAGLGATTAVDRYPGGASVWGVLDLAGNVEEWTADLYAPYPGGAFVSDHLSAANGRRYRVLRGGCFSRGGDLARCARRHGPHPGPDYRYRGFRVATSTI